VQSIVPAPLHFYGCIMDTCLSDSCNDVSYLLLVDFIPMPV